MESSSYIKSLKNVIFSKLIYLGIIKTGSFTLKNGSQSNIYMDLRQLINYPHLFLYLSKLLFLEYPNLLDIFSNSNSNNNYKGNTKLIPIPLGGIPLGFHLAFECKTSLLMIRDKAKDHGTKKLIEGIIESNDRYILIEDVITSGSSIIQTIEKITDHIKINSIQAIICICNRGNIETLQNIPVFSIFTLTEVQDYISNYLAPLNNISYFHYGTSFSNKLYQLALFKKSNIIISCDFMTNQEILNCLQYIGSFIIAVKVHLDILESSNYTQFLTDLNTLKIKHNFLVIEDAKYADIDSIMIEKINNSQLDINNIADAFTMHAIAGLSILEEEKLKIPAIIVSEMSSSNNIITKEFTQKIINIIREKKENIDKRIMLGGLVCQTHIPTILNPFEIATLTPGINLELTNDTHNQQYKIPNLIDYKVGLFWIVGRGITSYKNNFEKLKTIMNEYQSIGWDYFIKY